MKINFQRVDTCLYICVCVFVNIHKVKIKPHTIRGLEVNCEALQTRIKGRRVVSYNRSPLILEGNK